LRVRAHDARQPADLLARDRIAFVRHRRRALLLLAEILFGLANFGALQVANLGGDLVQRGRDHRQRDDVEGMAIALNHLRRDCCDVQAQSVTDFLLVLRFEVGCVSHRAGKLADTHLLGRKLKALDVALHLRIPVGQLEAERNRLGVDSVGAADRGSVLELPGAPLQHLAKFRQVVANDGRRLLHQQRLRGVNHVIRRESIMEPARLRPYLFRYGGGEGDDVMLHFGFNLVDASNIDVALFANGLGR